MPFTEAAYRARWPEQTDMERLEARYIPEPMSGCWLWLNSPCNHGYGQIELQGRNILAHRFSYSLFRGEIPKGMLVLHRCDTPMCVNPDHLFLGTDADNRRDCIQKGRAYLAGAPKGTANPGAKFTEEQVRAIRQDPRPQATIGKDYGVGQGTVGRIKRRERYGNIA